MIHKDVGRRQKEEPGGGMMEDDLFDTFAYRQTLLLRVDSIISVRTARQLWMIVVNSNDNERQRPILTRGNCSASLPFFVYVPAQYALDNDGICQ